METLFIGKNLLFLHEVESTNTYAMNLLRNVNPIEGTVVYTDHQTKGKGQRGATWTSEIGQNITASVILKPHFLGHKQTFYLSKISALAVYDVLTEILPIGQYDIKIKWPNDILVNHQKIAGILIENSFLTNSIQYSVIGVGFNINQCEFDGYERTAVSLKLLLNKDIDRTQIMEMLCRNLEKWYLKLKEQKLHLIDSTYLSILFGINQKLMFENSNGISFRGEPTGVSNEGKLIVILEDSTSKEFDIRELKFLI
ncbi:MAG: biotin--[acetyl-CoA-carboxylase] ligase [Burkholderiales bacterium]|nr:biotin--[acetyl-CoA-carboxylase] ligase [Bacteroidia bacterium]